MDLALGLAIAWIPVFVLSNIVDRNPVSAEDIRRKLNRYLLTTRKALLDRETRTQVAASLALGVDDQKSFHVWEESASPNSSGEPRLMCDIFDEFAGQGRFHWHEGVGHPIMASISHHVGRLGRCWLNDTLETRRALLCENGLKGIFLRDPKKWWYVLQGLGVSHTYLGT
jgi:hypothetical protein